MKSTIFQKVSHFFRIFKGYSGTNLYFLVFVTFLASSLSGIGIALFIPLLGMGSESTGPANVITILLRGFFGFFNLPVTFTNILLLIVLIFCVKAVFLFSQAYYISFACSDGMMRLRMSLMERYEKVSYAYHTKSELGYFNNIVSTEIDRAINCFHKFLLLIVKSINIFIFLCFSFFLNWQLTAIAIVSGIVVIFAMWPLSRAVTRISADLSDANHKVQKFFIQFVQNFKYLKGTSNFEMPVLHFRGSIKRHRNLSIKTHALNHVTNFSLEPVGVMIVAVALYFWVEVQLKPFTVVAVPLYFLYKTNVEIFAFQRVWQLFNSTSGGLFAYEKARQQLGTYQEEYSGEIKNDFSSEIRLLNVHFSYGRKKVLSDINLTIPKNKMVAIVGPSGAGKTTLIDIIDGLYLPGSGEILIDGIDYRGLNRYELRKLFGYVTQDSLVFNDTIANNISFWTAGENEQNWKRMEAAARLAHCHEFIEMTGKKYNSVVGEQGIKLSGGQKQRLMIAREIYQDRPILILDEATSSLDSESEHFIQESIDQISGKKTILVIAHRLATIRRCDYIYVVKEGSVVEEGGWTDLTINRDSLFSKMIDQQKVYH